MASIRSFVRYTGSRSGGSGVLGADDFGASVTASAGEGGAGGEGLEPGRSPGASLEGS